MLKIDENRYRQGEIRAFYEAAAYPLPRKKSESKEEPAPAVAKTPERKPAAAAAPVKSKTAARKPALKSKSAA